MRVAPAGHPVGLGVALGSRVHLEQAARRLEEIGKPLPDCRAFALGGNGVAPDRHGFRPRLQAGPIQRHIQVSHARRGQAQRVGRERGADQRHRGPLPLGHELTIGADQHPAPVLGQAGPVDGGFRQVDACAGFDRVDMQAEDTGGHGGEKSAKNARKDSRERPVFALESAPGASMKNVPHAAPPACRPGGALSS
ncbi:hypothetical protein G6F57_019536 [Rhizopus arrhizus]|nr:hypothetical protein G6F57_019536 [Rhizopus arrhizus]